jgi:hypothetical protein
MPESFYPLAISCVFRENTFCVRNGAMIGRIPPLLSTTWIWDGCPAIQFVADSQNPMGSKCQGTRFEISWYRTSCRKNLLPTKNQPSGGRMLETTRSDHMPGIAWSYVRRVQMFFAQWFGTISTYTPPTADPFQYIWSLSHTKNVQKPDRTPSQKQVTTYADDRLVFYATALCHADEDVVLGGTIQLGWESAQIWCQTRHLDFRWIENSKQSL